VEAASDADVAIVKVGSPKPAAAGNPLTYLLTVTNNGPGIANGVVVTDMLPAGLNFVSASSGAGPCFGMSTVTCNLGSLAPRGTATVALVVQPTLVGIVSNTATVSTSGSDPLSTNDSSTDMTTVVSGPDLTLTKTHAPDFFPGEVGATYTLTVKNSGVGAAFGTVTVSDMLPSGLTATGIVGMGWGCTPPGGPCTRSDGLAVGASYPPITLTVDVAGNAPAMVTNMAIVSGGGETVTANDGASDPTCVDGELPAVTPPADATVTQTLCQ